MKKYGFADALRGPAALFVVASHFMAVALPKWHFGLLGQLGVAIFFLVSGFVIPISLTRYKVGAFLVARVLRIYPTYAVALTITIISIWMAGEQPLGYDILRYVSNYAIAGILFNQPYFDPVVWTLQIELHFYIICALLAPGIRAFRPEVLAAPVVIFVAAIYGFHSGVPIIARLSGEASCLLFMFGGVAAFYFMNGQISAKTLKVYCASCFVLCALAWWYVSSPVNLLPSYAVAVVIFLLALFHGDRMRGGFFSKISYPLYVVHAGIGLFILKWMLLHSASAYTAILMASLLTVGVTVLVHTFVEAPTHRLGQRIAANLTDDAPRRSVPQRTRSFLRSSNASWILLTLTRDPANLTLRPFIRDDLELCHRERGQSPASREELSACTASPLNIFLRFTGRQARQSP